MPYFTVRGPVPLAVAYVGPGDIVASAEAWWGLRGYTAAYAAGNGPCIAVVDTATGLVGPTTINVTTAGALDVATIAGLGYAVSVTKLYDQAGNSRHLSQSTLSKMPTLELNVFGSLPSMRFVTASVSQLITTGGSNPAANAQPLSTSWVARRTGATVAGDVIHDFAASNLFGYFNSAADQVGMYAGGAGGIVVAGAEGVLHAVHCLFNGASSEIVVDGASNTGDPGNANMTDTTAFVGSNASSAQVLTGDLCELGLWYVLFSAGNKTDLTANEQTYWGF
jgi:hypothetical protein